MSPRLPRRNWSGKKIVDGFIDPRGPAAGAFPAVRFAALHVIPAAAKMAAVRLPGRIGAATDRAGFSLASVNKFDVRYYVDII